MKRAAKIVARGYSVYLPINQIEWNKRVYFKRGSDIGYINLILIASKKHVFRNSQILMKIEDSQLKELDISRNKQQSFTRHYFWIEN